MKLLLGSFLLAVVFVFLGSFELYAECDGKPIIGERTVEGKCYEYMILKDCGANQETEVERDCGSEEPWTTVYNGPIRGSLLLPGGLLFWDLYGNGVGSVSAGTGGHWMLAAASPVVKVHFIPDNSSILMMSEALFRALGF